MQPDGPVHGLDGMKHMASAMVPADLRPDARRREPRGRDRGGLRDVPAPRAGGGGPRRPLRRRQRRRGAPRRARDGGPAGDDRDDPLRRRRALPLRSRSGRSRDRARPEGSSRRSASTAARPIRRSAAARCSGPAAAAGAASRGSSGWRTPATTSGARRYVIEPLEYLRVERQADAESLALLGFYHSHPDHPAVPSEYDREHALSLLSLCRPGGRRRSARRGHLLEFFRRTAGRSSGKRSASRSSGE